VPDVGRPDDAVAIEHRVIVRHERTGPRTYCYCGWASSLRISYDEMVAELYAHLDTPEPPRVQPTLF
jgi:hypothetical protein